MAYRVSRQVRNQEGALQPASIGCRSTADAEMVLQGSLASGPEAARGPPAGPCQAHLDSREAAGHHDGVAHTADVLHSLDVVGTPVQQAHQHLNGPRRTRPLLGSLLAHTQAGQRVAGLHRSRRSQKPSDKWMGDSGSLKVAEDASHLDDDCAIAAHQ